MKSRSDWSKRWVSKVSIKSTIDWRTWAPIKSDQTMLITLSQLLRGHWIQTIIMYSYMEEALIQMDPQAQIFLNSLLRWSLKCNPRWSTIGTKLNRIIILQIIPLIVIQKITTQVTILRSLMIEIRTECNLNFSQTRMELCFTIKINSTFLLKVNGWRQMS